MNFWSESLKILFSFDQELRVARHSNAGCFLDFCFLCARGGKRCRRSEGRNYRNAYELQQALRYVFVFKLKPPKIIQKELFIIK